jgi:hypothetical protein
MWWGVRQKAFGDLNRDFLGPPDDGKIIILSDSDEEEEEEEEEEEKVCKEKTIDTKVASSSAARSPTPTTSADDADKGNTPDWVIGGSSSDGDEANFPYATTLGWRLQWGVL